MNEPQANTSLEAADEPAAPASTGAIVAGVSALIGAWVAAGSTGLLAHAFRRGLLWTSLAVIVAAAWPRGKRVGWHLLALLAGIIAALAMAAPRLPASNVLAVVVVLGILTLGRSRADRRVMLLAGLAVVVFAIYRHANTSIPRLWLFTDAVGGALGRFAGGITGMRLWVGSTFAGIDLLVVMCAFYIAWLVAARPAWKPAVAAAVAILAGHLFYVCLLTFVPGLLQAMPNHSTGAPASYPMWPTVWSAWGPFKTGFLFALCSLALYLVWWFRAKPSRLRSLAVLGVVLIISALWVCLLTYARDWMAALPTAANPTKKELPTLAGWWSENRVSVVFTLCSLVLYALWWVHAKPARVAALFLLAALLVVCGSWIDIFPVTQNCLRATSVGDPAAKYWPPRSVWSFIDSIRTVIPWNIPLIGCAVHAAAAAVLFRLAGRPAPAGKRPAQLGYILVGAAVILAAILPVLGTLSSAKLSLEGKKVVIYKEGFLNWLKPKFEDYGRLAIGMYGTLPAHIESFGGKCLISPKLSTADLKDADLLILLFPDNKWNKSKIEKIRRSVQRGELVLLLPEDKIYGSEAPAKQFERRAAAGDVEIIIPDGRWGENKAQLELVRELLNSGKLVVLVQDMGQSEGRLAQVKRRVTSGKFAAFAANDDWDQDKGQLERINEFVEGGKTLLVFGEHTSILKKDDGKRGAPVATVGDVLEWGRSPSWMRTWVEYSAVNELLQPNDTKSEQIREAVKSDELVLLMPDDDVNGSQSPAVRFDRLTVAGKVEMLTPDENWGKNTAQLDLIRKVLKSGKAVALVPDEGDSEDQLTRLEELVKNRKFVFCEAKDDWDEAREQTEMRVVFDSATFEVGGWLQSYEALSHPATTGMPDDYNEFGVVIGASLRLQRPAKPLLIGRWGWGDPGDPKKGRSMMGNHLYDPGERLGDVLLAAEQQVGEGRVIAFGDTSSITNGISTGAYKFTSRLMAYAAGNSGGPHDTWRGVLGLLAALALAAILVWRPSPQLLIAPALVFAISLAVCTGITYRASTLLPDGRGKILREASEYFSDGNGKTPRDASEAADAADLLAERAADEAEQRIKELRATIRIIIEDDKRVSKKIRPKFVNWALATALMKTRPGVDPAVAARVVIPPRAELSMKEAMRVIGSLRSRVRDIGEEGGIKDDALPDFVESIVADATKGSRKLPINNLAYIDNTHLEQFSSESWRADGTMGITLTLMRDGYIVRDLEDFSAERLDRAGLVLSIAPGREFTRAERKAVWDFVDGGGIFIITVGYEDAKPSRSLLADFGLFVGLEFPYEGNYTIGIDPAGPEKKAGGSAHVHGPQCKPGKIPVHVHGPECKPGKKAPVHVHGPECGVVEPKEEAKPKEVDEPKAVDEPKEAEEKEPVHVHGPECKPNEKAAVHVHGPECKPNEKAAVHDHGARAAKLVEGAAGRDQGVTTPTAAEPDEDSTPKVFGPLAADGLRLKTRIREPNPPGIAQTRGHIYGHFKSSYATSRTSDGGFYQLNVRLNAAWVVNYIKDWQGLPDARVITDTFWRVPETGIRINLPTILVRTVGRGKFVLVGDSGFAMNKNLEVEGGWAFEGMRENPHFWRWLLAGLRGNKPWIPPDPRPMKAADDERHKGCDECDRGGGN